MRVLVACEYSGAVRDSFLALGHEAVSCDLLPTDAPGPHYQGDVTNLLEGWKPVVCAGDMLECEECEEPFCPEHGKHYGDCHCFGPTDDSLEYTEKDGILFARPLDSPHWDLMICHPPCTYLTSAGLHWNKRRPERAVLTEEALQFIKVLLDAPIAGIALENPVGCISSRIRKPDQIIQPYNFGADASKATCLWLKGLPLLTPTERFMGRTVEVNGKKVERFSNQTDSGQNNLPPSSDRWKLRSATYPGIAHAMASQWGGQV